MEYAQSAEKTPKRSFKKRLIKALIILVAVLLAFEALWAGLWAYINFYRFGTWEYKVENFKEYRADFEAVKDECLNYINTHPGLEEEPDFVYGKDGDELNLFIDGNTVIDSESGKQHLKRVAEAFPRKAAYFSYIKYENGCLYFCSEIHDYKMVYSPDNETTDTLKSVEDHSTRKAAEHWYHMAKTKTDTSGYLAPLIVRVFQSR